MDSFAKFFDTFFVTVEKVMSLENRIIRSTK